uniref:hypothetical protein n=1 Tax=Paracoccus sp. TRP TaxID=412597 RepID=UPI000225F44A|nr:hypothetical protein [Paracoccus sp. TRP]
MTHLTAPDHLRGRMSRWTPQELRDERAAWIMARAAEGWTMPPIARALGIRPLAVNKIAYDAGYRWWQHKRHIQHPRCRPVTVADRTWPSIRALARDIGRTDAWVAWRLDNGRLQDIEAALQEAHREQAS